MAKPKIPNQRKANIEHKKRVERYVALIQKAYDRVADEAARKASLTGIDPDKPFSFDDYPLTKKAIQELQAQLTGDVSAVIMAGTSDEWKESNLVQDLVAKKVLTAYTGTSKGGEQYTRYFETNPESLKAFQQRRDRGMNLSTRVWNLTEQYKAELEDSISAAIAPGTSAMRLAADVKKYLNEPDKRFRRVKDKYGKLQLSKNAEAYHPGQGVYRSSARNAQRLARTEINMAYRTAEQERWKQFDFVVGYEVKTTQNGKHETDICDCLSGKYPKTFKFMGWHPMCLCYAIPLLKTEDEFWSLDDNARSVNEVTDVPQGFKDWVSDNRDRIERAAERGKLPYFIRDNREAVQHILKSEEVGKNAVRENPYVIRLAEELRRSGNLEGSASMEDTEIMKVWWGLTDAERLRVLEQGGFTGMISNEGDLEFASLYHLTTKESMLSTLQDELQNLKDGYDMEDTNHYVIKFKAREPLYSYDLTKPLTKSEIGKLEWISANEGMSNYRYWAKDETALTELMNHMAFCEYKEGKLVRSWDGKDVLGKTISDSYRGNFFARTLDNIQTSLISRQFKGIESFEELSSKASELLSKAVGNDVSVVINPGLMTMDIAKAHLTELVSITRDYNIRQGELTEVILGYVPKDSTEYGITIFTPSSNSKRMYLTQIIDNRESEYALLNSRCDKRRLPFSLASHEGGHLLFNFDSPAYGEFIILKQSIIQIWNEYISEYSKFTNTGKIQERGSIFIGGYGHDSSKLGEFMAECFQEYRNSSKPSKYALKIGELIDLYFKK